MTHAARTFAWLAACAAIFLAVRSSLGEALSCDQASSLLSSLGFFFTIANGMLVLLFRSFNEPPPKDLGASRKRRMKRMFDSRLRIAWRRYFLSLAASFVAVMCAWWIKNVSEAPRETLTAVGVVALMHGVVFGALAIAEYKHVTATVRNLAEELERRKAKLDALQRLERPDN